MTDWRGKAAALAAELTESGYLRTPAWQRVFADVPRHELVPYFYTQRADASWQRHDQSTTDEWLDTIYSDTTLVTTLSETHPRWGTGQIAVSSSTAPGLMALMLEALDVADGMRVLEIGTGTGYNATLLACRLGDGNVCSVDVDAELVDLAATRLAALGHRPTLLARDGTNGVAEAAPYDRIIATCAVSRIPRQWAEQLAPGGLLLTDFVVGGLAGNLVALHRRGAALSGRFLPFWGGFMNLRSGDAAAPAQPRRDRTQASTRRTDAPDEPWSHRVPWFLAQFAMPAHLTYGTRGDTGGTFLSSSDGSWCEIEAGDGESRTVWEAGPSELWRPFEQAYAWWQAAGAPGWQRFGMTVHQDGKHTIWLDDPERSARWTLPPG